jgi:tripartite-type tricarboxylate transporter receptor subunit TctC
MRRALIGLAWIAGLCAPLHAEPVADFYKGKTIRVIVGQPAGDIYDTWARLIVRHMKQHVPGNPNMLVENMPGGGTLVAANFVYNRAPQDGTVLGSSSRNMPNYAFTKKPNVQFDPLRFNWIGSPELTGRGCYARVDSGVTEAAHLFERELVVGTDGAGTAASETPTLLRNLLGMKFRTVEGYHGTNGVALAIERNEVKGICQSIAGFEQIARPMLESGTVRLLLTIESKRVAGRNVPTAFDFAKIEEQRQILAFNASTLELGRPWAAPPGVPPERVAALRAAFNATMRDDAFLAEAKQRGLEVTLRTGEELTAIVQEAAAFPPHLLARMVELTKR